MQGLVLAEFADLTFGLALGGGGRQRLGNRFAVNFIGEAEVRAVGRLVGLMATAVGLATAAGGGGDGTTAQVAEVGDLTGDLGAALGKGFEGQKESTLRVLTFKTHTHAGTRNCISPAAVLSMDVWEKYKHGIRYS